jgi:hypothetical protein
MIMLFVVVGIGWWEIVDLFWFGESESTHTKLGKWEVYQWKAWDDGSFGVTDWRLWRARNIIGKDVFLFCTRMLNRLWMVVGVRCSFLKKVVVSEQEEKEKGSR